MILPMNTLFPNNCLFDGYSWNWQQLAIFIPLLFCIAQFIKWGAAFIENPLVLIAIMYRAGFANAFWMSAFVN